MRKGCVIAAAAGLGVVTVASLFGIFRVVTMFYDFPFASRELPSAVREYRKNGLPFLASDLFPGKVSSKENAVGGIKIAIRAMPGPKVDQSLTAALKKAPSADLDPILSKYGPSLWALEAAIDRPKVDFGRDWDLGTQMQFPEYRPLKNLAKAAAARAGRSAARGNDDAALADLTLARQISLWSGQEPSLISMLVRISTETIILEGLERCLEAAAADPRRIARYQAWLAKSPPLPEFQQALRGEAFLGVTTARNLDVLGGVKSLGTYNDEPIKVDPADLHRSGVPEDEKSRAFLARHLQIWNEIYQKTNDLTLPPREVAREMDAVDLRLENVRGLSYILQRIMMPIFTQAGAAIVQLEARRAVQAGLAEALTVHAKTGQWPTKVSQIDPFTGQPLKVKIDGAEFRVYSIGKDGKDDGGLFHREKAAKGKIVDEVAVYPPKW